MGSNALRFLRRKLADAIADSATVAAGNYRRRISAIESGEEPD